MKLRKQVLAMALAIVTLLMLAAPAFAADQKVASTGLNVRKGPGTAYGIVTELEKGDVVTVTGTSGKWSYVTLANGTKGYVSSAYLEDYVPDTKVLYASAAVNVRKGPGTSYAKAGELKKGEAVSYVGTVGKWTMINWADGVAYVSSDYLTAKAPETQAPSTVIDTSKLEVAYATAAVNVRKGAGTSYTKIGELSKGQSVYVTGVTTTSGWVQVVYNNQIGYVSSAYLSNKVASDSAAKYIAYAKFADVKVYKSASVSAAARGYLDKGDKVEILDMYGDWACISFGANKGYVLLKQLYFDNELTVAATGIVYAKSSVLVRQGPGTSYAAFGYLMSGESATRTGVSGTWTRIDFNGKVGYVPTAQIKELNVSAGTTAGYYVFAKKAGVKAYSVPSAKTQYYLGYMDKGEPAWCVSANDVWSKVTIEGTTMYVQTKDLSRTPIAGVEIIVWGDEIFLGSGSGSYGSGYADLKKSAAVYKYFGGTEVVDTVYKSDGPVYVLESRAHWSQIRFYDKSAKKYVYGWIDNDYLEF